MIANSRLIISEYKLLQKVTDAIQKRKIFMESEEFNFSSNGEIELGLYEFAERYMYTSLCKERIHQKYPQPIQKMMSTTSKLERVKTMSAYHGQEGVVESLVRKTEDFLEK